MADLVNFNKARKAKSRDQGRAQAAQNRVAFGRTKAEKTVTTAEREKADRTLDGAKRED
ncbi:DUF4169 family protein [Phenylobacterium sp.]|uniref:DUF4169 family protein n=1 Tax=Phenylobacterium sp. TaxID=1871053 RepID=UPI0027356D11|nr:DUF4169 family protein [Phenylobacterium sp.]MDP3854320.1 DUF4169 family protein [Phenylobacterium sp.]